MDAAYLGQHVNKFSFRHNSPKIKDGERFTSLLRNVEGRLLVCRPEREAFFFGSWPRCMAWVGTSVHGLLQGFFDVHTSTGK
ncbi:MAG: hypothetical protein WEC75_06090 [Dehalococcoidia bacterium]